MLLRLGAKGPIPIELVFPEITKEDLAFLRALRPKYDRVTAAQRLKAQGRLEEALEAAAALMHDEPSFGPGIDVYVDIAQAMNRLDDAANRFEARADGPPPRWTAWYGLAKVQLARDAKDSALEAARRAIDEGCDYWGCYNAVALVFRYEGKERTGLDDGMERTAQGERYFRELLASGSVKGERESLARLGLLILLMAEGSRRVDAVEIGERVVPTLRPGRGWEVGRHNLSNVRAWLNRVEGAVVSNRLKCLAVARVEGDRWFEARILNAIGNNCQGYDTRLSIDYYENAMATAREVGDRDIPQLATFNLANVYAGLGQVQTALEYYQRQIAMTRRPGYQPGWTEVLMGKLYTRYFDLQKGLELIEQVVAKQREGGGTAGGVPLSTLADVYAEHGRLREAISIFQYFLEQEHLSPGNGGLPGVLGNMAAIYGALGETQRATEYFQRALAIRQELGGADGGAPLLGQAGAFFVDTGDVERGMTYIRQALEASRQPGSLDRGEEGRNLGRLGDAWYKLGQTQEASDRYREAVTVLRETGELIDQAAVLGKLGRVSCDLGRVSEGIAALQEALSLLARVGALGEQQELERVLARAYESQGDRAGALLHAERSLELLEHLTTDLQDPDLEASFVARSVLPHAFLVRLLSSEMPGASGAPFTAEMQARTFALAEQARARSFHRRCQLAKIDLTEGAPSETLLHLREAGRRLTQVRDFLSSERMSPIERGMLAGWIEEQLNPALERERISSGPETDSVTTLQRQLKCVETDTLSPVDRRTLLQGLLRTREQDYADAERALRDASPAYRQVVDPSLASLADVQAALNDDTVMLAYLLGDEESFAWVVTHTETHLLHLPPEAVITKHIDVLRRRLMAPETSLRLLSEAALEAYQTLLAPAAAWIPAGARLVIVPDSSLGQLPFAALLSRPTGPGERVPAWLGLEHAIRYAPSATVWQASQRRPATARIDGPMLLVGDPIYHVDHCNLRTLVATNRGAESRAGLYDERWNRLCYAGQEVDLITRARRKGLFNHPGDRYLLMTEASEAAFRTQDLSRFSILHFSTHAKAWEDVPLRSAIVLSQAPASPDGQPENTSGYSTDGYLELRELHHLHLNADLVVLSACETAQGRARHGEGVESLARGFLMAGAKQVLATQWAVADQSTARFMGRFYQELRHAPVDDALLRTQRAFISDPKTKGKDGQGKRRPSPDYSHPYYWAPFVLIEGTMPDGARP